MKNLLIAAAAISAVAFTGFSASAQAPQQYDTNPGIVMAGSQDYSKIPGKAKKFIDKHFKGVAVRSCEQEFAKGKYDVELANGVEIEFNNNGDILEVDAPDNAYLSPAVAKDLLHDSAFGQLEKKGLLDKVESIEFKKGRAVEVSLDIPDPDTYIFDIDGNVIAVDD